jgi:hypothetical protein
MRKIINIVEKAISESFVEVEKFWIDSNNGTFEALPEDGEHEDYLPGDESLGFEDSIRAGWVRGGYKSSYNTNMYLQGRDIRAVRKSLGIALNHYAPEEIYVEWNNTFVKLEGGMDEIERFLKRGVLPRA